MSSIQKLKIVSEVRNTILHTALELLRADRADIMLWDESKRDLVVAAHSGESVWVFRSVLSASINTAFRLRPYESPYNSSC